MIALCRLKKTKAKSTDSVETLHRYNGYNVTTPKAQHFFCPRITRIDTNIGRGFVLPKLREVAHRILCFLFAFIRVFRGLNFRCGYAALWINHPATAA